MSTTSRSKLPISIGLTLSFVLGSCKPRTEQQETALLATNQSFEPEIEPKRHDYNHLFELARLMLTNAKVREFHKVIFKEALVLDPNIAAAQGFKNNEIKDLSEPQFIGLMQHVPAMVPTIEGFLKDLASGQITDTQTAKWRQIAIDGLKDNKFKQQFISNNDPLNPYMLQAPNKAAGYRNLKMFVSHATLVNGQVIPKDDLSAVWANFIRGAKKELVLNVFDFDHMGIAQELAALAKRGVKVRVGIDTRIVNDEHKPGGKRVFDFLKSNGVMVTAVNSVGLNHQKISARDWSLEGRGAAILSSANLTHSGINPKGDAHDQRVGNPERSIPNANNVITLESDIIAALINHEMSKVVGPRFFLRGSQLPLSGAYSIKGPVVNFGGRKIPTGIVLAFTPGGGLKKINELMLGRVIKESSGPIHMAQFAFSSTAVESALFKRAAREGQNFRFLSVGDTPFAVQFWSRFLSLVDIERQNSETVYFPKSGSGGWRKLMGQASFNRFIKRVCVAPPIYGDSFTDHFNPDGTPVLTQAGKPAKFKLSAKIHHKLIVTGMVASVGTSFNFSQGAETNSEQVVFVNDPNIALRAQGIVEALASKSELSVVGEVMRRNGAKIRFAKDDKVVVVNESTQRKEVTATPKQLKDRGLILGDPNQFKCDPR
jgi:phosphatidylserine/phosphatidylglycerophosphate/cardiolipin synthase-like enzyme